MVDGPDSVTVEGLGKHLDGTYRFDCFELVGIGQPGALNLNEVRVFKEVAGVGSTTAIVNNLADEDYATHVALAAVVLSRSGKHVTIERLAVLPMSAFTWDFYPRRTEDRDDDADPPTGAEEPPSANGGTSSSGRSDNQEIDPPPTGHPGSERSATSAPLTLAN